MKLEVRNLSVSLGGHEIVKDIHFEAGRELTVLLGLNGAGKSTLLRTLAGMIPAGRECILYDGKDLYGMDRKKRAGIFSYIPQETEEGINCTVAEFVATGANPRMSFWQMPGEAERNRVSDILKQDDMLYLADRRMNTLSGGEKKMTYLSRSKMQGAEFLLMDEPTAHLDYRKQHCFMENVLKSIRQEGKGVLMTLHDPQMACRYADRILFLHGGCILGEVRKGQENGISELSALLKEIYGEEICLKAGETEIFITWKERDEKC